MTLVKFVQAVEAKGCICLLQTHIDDTNGKTFVGAMVTTKPDPYSDSLWERRANCAAWALIINGSVPYPDYVFAQIEKIERKSSMANRNAAT